MSAPSGWEIDGIPIRHFGEALRLGSDAPLHRPAHPTRTLPRAA